MNDIDIVDPEWRRAFEKARTESGGDNPVVATGGDENASKIRYRDWGTLPFLFRGIERFAPWVRRVHLVTWGHQPEWLDTTNLRLNVVKHSDYIPADFE